MILFATAPPQKDDPSGGRPEGPGLDDEILSNKAVIPCLGAVQLGVQKQSEIVRFFSGRYAKGTVLRALLILEAKALVAKRNVRSDARRVVYVCSPQGRALLATSVLGAVGDLLVEGVQVRESRQQPLASDIQVPPIRIPLPEAGTNSPAGVPK